MADDIVERLKQRHPIQYGFIGTMMISHTEHMDDERVTARMNRCPICEQWSPCDVREATDEIERLRALVDRVTDEREVYRKAHISVENAYHERGAEIERLRAAGDALADAARLAAGAAACDGLTTQAQDVAVNGVFIADAAWKEARS